MQRSDLQGLPVLQGTSKQHELLGKARKLSLLSTQEPGEWRRVRAPSSHTEGSVKCSCYGTLQPVAQGSRSLDPLLHLNLIVAAFNNWMNIQAAYKGAFGKGCWDKNQQPEAEMGNKQTIFTQAQLDAYHVQKCLNCCVGRTLKNWEVFFLKQSLKNIK